MNEEVKKQILDVLKGFAKGVLKDSILIVLFFVAIGYFIRQSELCDVQVLVRNASELIAILAVLRGIFATLHIAAIVSKKKSPEHKLSEEEIASLDVDYSESLEDYKEVFDLGSPVLTKYLNAPNSALNKDTLVAGLVDLIRKEKVRAEGPFLVVIDDNVSSNCEKFLLSKIKDGRFAMGTEGSFYSDLSIYSAVDLVNEMKLLKKSEPKHKGHGKMILFTIIFLFCCAVVAGEDSLWYSFCEFGAMALAVYGLGYAASLSKLKPTKEGERLNRKIEGLKKHLLKSYEVLAQQNDSELMNQYLLHTIVFGHNPKIVEEYMKFVDITPTSEN